MASEWKKLRIKDVVSFVVDNRGKTPPMQDEGHILLEVNAVSATEKFPLYQEVRKHVSQEVYDTRFRKGHPKKGDILVPTVGTLGAVSLMNRDDCCIAQNLIALRCDEAICHSHFLYYVLCNPLTRKRLLNLNIGGVQPSIKVPHLMELEIELPGISEQKKIAKLLSLMDDKIFCNKRINDNLLQQLQAIYQMMFGQASQNVELGGRLSDICAYSQRRIAVSSLSLESYYSTENMLPGKAGAVAASSLPSVAQATGCMPGDILISNIRPYFKKIVYSQSECGCSADVLCFVPKAPAFSLFLFSTLYDDHFFDYMVAGSKGTKMPRGDKQQIMAYSVIMPSAAQLAEFNSVAQPILSKIETSNQENKRLVAMRDTLLPRLMSGEIDVSGVTL